MDIKITMVTTFIVLYYDYYSILSNFSIGTRQSIIAFLLNKCTTNRSFSIPFFKETDEEQKNCVIEFYVI